MLAASVGLDVPDVERTWTLRQARAARDDIDELLRSVRSIVERRQDAAAEAERLRGQWKAQLDDAACPARPAYLAAIHDVQEAQSRLHEIVNAFFTQGVEVHSDGGGVDFLSRAGTGGAWLCYRPLEGDVTHWHELGETCDDRRPLPRADF